MHCVLIRSNYKLVHFNNILFQTSLYWTVPAKMNQCIPKERWRTALAFRGVSHGFPYNSKITYLHYIIVNNNGCAYNAPLHCLVINLFLALPVCAIPNIKHDRVIVPIHVKNYSTPMNVVSCIGYSIIDIEVKPKIRRRKCAIINLRKEEVLSHYSFPG